MLHLHVAIFIRGRTAAMGAFQLADGAGAGRRGSVQGFPKPDLYDGIRWAPPLHLRFLCFLAAITPSTAIASRFHQIHLDIGFITRCRNVCHRYVAPEAPKPSFNELRTIPESLSFSTALYGY